MDTENKSTLALALDDLAAITDPEDRESIMGYVREVANMALKTMEREHELEMRIAAAPQVLAELTQDRAKVEAAIARQIEMTDDIDEVKAHTEKARAFVDNSDATIEIVRKAMESDPGELVEVREALQLLSGSMTRAEIETLLQ